MLSEQTTNNYEKWCEEWGRRFLTLDQEALLKRVPGLTKKETALHSSIFSNGTGFTKEPDKLKVRKALKLLRLLQN